MTNQSNYSYEEHWKPKRFWTRKKALIGAAVLAVVLLIGQTLVPQWLAPTPIGATPTARVKLWQTEDAKENKAMPCR